MLKLLMQHLYAADNPDLSDGAWWATLEDAVNQFNKDHGTDFDPHDSVLAYTQNEDTY